MPEISWGAKIVVLLACIAVGALLVGWDKIFKKKKPSPKVDKAE